MATTRSLATAVILLGFTSFAFAQGAGIGPASNNLPPQSAYNYGSASPFGGTPYYGPYNEAFNYYGSGYAKPRVVRRHRSYAR